MLSADCLCLPLWASLPLPLPTVLLAFASELALLASAPITNPTVLAFASELALLASAPITNPTGLAFASSASSVRNEKRRKEEAGEG